jgi:hypothetical protein
MRKQSEVVNKFKDQNERRKFDKAIDNLKKGFQPRSNGCRNKDGEIVREEGKILQRWEEYFTELLNIEKVEEERERDKNDQEETRTGRRVIGEDEEVSTPTREEVEKCIRKTKNNKAPGKDGTTAELVK